LSAFALEGTTNALVRSTVSIPSVSKLGFFATREDSRQDEGERPQEGIDLLFQGDRDQLTLDPRNLLVFKVELKFGILVGQPRRSCNAATRAVNVDQSGNVEETCFNDLHSSRSRILVGHGRNSYPDVGESGVVEL
jgi:hypothetical protein